MLELRALQVSLWILTASIVAIAVGSVLWLAGVTTPLAGALILCSAPVLVLAPLWVWLLGRSLRAD